MSRGRAKGPLLVLVSDLVKRKKWYLVVLCGWMLFLAFGTDVEASLHPEKALVLIVLNGMGVLAVVMFVIVSDGSGGFIRVRLSLPIRRSQLSLFEWCSSTLVPLLSMIITGLILGLAWRIHDLPYLLFFILPAVAGMGAWWGLIMGFYDLQAQKINVLGFLRSGGRILLCIASLLILYVICEGLVRMLKREEGMQPGHAMAIVAGIGLYFYSWSRRDSLLEIHNGKWDGFFAPRKTLNHSVTLTYPRTAGMDPYLIPTLLPVAVTVLLGAADLRLIIHDPPEAYLFWRGIALATRLTVLMSALFGVMSSSTFRFPFREYASIPIGRWGVMARLMTFHCLPSALCLVVAAPIILIEPDGVAFLAVMLCVLAGLSCVSGAARLVLPRAAHISFTVFIAGFTLLKSVHAVSSDAVDRTRIFRNAAFVGLLIPIGVSVAYVALSRGSRAFRVSEKLKAKNRR